MLRSHYNKTQLVLINDLSLPNTACRAELRGFNYYSFALTCVTRRVTLQHDILNRIVRNDKIGSYSDLTKEIKRTNRQSSVLPEIWHHSVLQNQLLIIINLLFFNLKKR
jgi:hypothetical protein